MRNNPTEHSFEDIYQAYGEKILNLAFRLSGNQETARDLTQEIFIKIYQNLPSFEGKSHIYTWMYRIAVNHISNYVKKERRYRWLDLLDKSISDTLREAVMIVSSTLDPRQVVSLLLDELQKVVTYHFASVMLVKDENLTRLIRRNEKGDSFESFTFPIDVYPLNAEVLHSKRPIVIPDVIQAFVF